MILDWKKFVLRSDIRNLPLEEQRRKFLKEQLHHDNLLSEQIQRQKQHEFYMSQMQSKGGGGGGSTFSGNASDGPLSGATVTANIGSTTTNTLGNFTFNQIPSGEITVIGGTDAITGITFTGELKGFPQFKTISPLTTLAYHLKEEDTNLTADTAVDLLFASSSTLFGIDLDITDKDVMLNKDYVAESILADNQAAVAAQSIATYLESVTEMVGSAVKGADSTNFTTNSAKIEGYKAIARQIGRTSGAKTEISTTELFDVIKLPNGNAWTGGLTGSLSRENRGTISTQLTNVKTQLGTLSRSEAFTANYLTTQIQAINRGVKEDYASDAKKLAEGTEVTFDSISVMVSKSTGSLAQIESGKTNENTRVEGEKPETFYTLGTMTFTQIDARDRTQTLSGDKFVSGSMKAIAATGSAFTEKDAVKKYILKPNRDALSLEGATKYSVRLGDITATQTTVSPENQSANKLIRITLSNPSLQIRAISLIDAPVAAHIFSTGTYLLSMAGSKVTQALTLNAGTPNSLSFGAIKALNIAGGITVIQDENDSTKFVVSINNRAVTDPGGISFSGNGDKSTLTFASGRNNYTITYKDTE